MFSWLPEFNQLFTKELGLVETKTQKEASEQFYYYLRRYKNIAISKIDEGDQDFVNEIVKNLVNKFKQIQELKEKHNQNYYYLLMDEEMAEEEISTAKYRDKGTEENVEEISFSDDFALTAKFSPEETFTGLFEFLNAFEEIWKKASEENEYEITKSVSYSLTNLIQHLCSAEKNNFLVENFLKKIHEMIRNRIQYHSDFQDPSINNLAYRWFTNVVFDHIRDFEKFRIEYLDLLSNHQFKEIKSIIDSDEFNTYRGLVSWFHDGITKIVHSAADLHDLVGALRRNLESNKLEEVNTNQQIVERCFSLNDDISDLTSIEDFHFWEEEFNEITEDLSRYLEGEIPKEILSIKDSVKQKVVHHLKLHRVKEITFAMGSYLLFKEKYKFISYLWKYKQPDDADATWSGFDPNPTSVTEALRVYFGQQGRLERIYEFHREHHGSEGYFKEYFVLIVLKIIRNQNETSFTLPDVQISRLKDIHYTTENLDKVAEQILSRTELLEQLGFDSDDKSEIKKELNEILDSIQQKAEQEIENQKIERDIDEEIVQNFKESFVESYHDNARAKNILSNFNLVENQFDKSKDLGKFGIKNVVDKSHFLSDWQGSGTTLGQNYGGNLASGENRELVRKISNQSKEIELTKLKEFLNENKDLQDLFILSVNVKPTKLSEINFIGDLIDRVPGENIGRIKVKYELDGEELVIPTFQILSPQLRSQILVVPSSPRKFGRLIQFSPSESDSDFPQFNINVEAFSHSERLRQKFLEDPPDWLKDIEEKNRESYLNDLVLIDIYESFNLELKDGYDGLTAYINL